MRDVLLMVGFAVCVVVGAVTVLWPALSTPDDAVKQKSNAPAQATPKS